MNYDPNFVAMIRARLDDLDDSPLRDDVIALLDELVTTLPPPSA